MDKIGLPIKLCIDEEDFMSKLRTFILVVTCIFVLSACNSNDANDAEGHKNNDEITTSSQNDVKATNQERQMGLFIPDYIDEVTSIDDLNLHKDLFDAEIIGIESDSNLIRLTEEMLDEYDLEFRLVSSSESIVLEELDNYINHHKQPILIALWQSHDAIEDMNLKMLKDPKNVYGNSADVAIYNGKSK